MEWYYHDGNAQVGPVEDAEFERLVASGTIGPRTPVWNRTMAQWLAYADVAPSRPAAAPAASDPGGYGTASAGGFGAAGGGFGGAASSVCTECGRGFPRDELLEYRDRRVCPDCKADFFEAIRAGVRTGGAMEYAGFWIRFAAKLIDGVVLQIIQLPLVIGLGGSLSAPTVEAQIAGIVVGLTYVVFFNGKFGATPGKMVCRIKIVTDDGEPISYLRAFARYLAEFLSALLCAIGYIMAAFDEEKRSLHDRICDTRVVRA